MAIIGLVALALAQMLLIVLLLTPLASAIDAYVRRGLVLAIFSVSAVLAAAGIVAANRQRSRHLKQLARANQLLNQVALSLDAPGAATRPPPDADLDSLIARLSEMVKQVQRVVEEGRQREREVIRADQLSMVGQMAAGVAHELRNPLTSIKMLVQTAQKQGAAGLVPEDMAIIEHEIRRLERSLQRFLDFARPPRPERRRSNLGDVANRTLALVEGRARKQKVQLRFDRPHEPLLADVDEDQIQQLLLNLLLNSLDVMPDGGAVTVKLTALPERKVQLSVCDTGPGIPAELMPRLFDPFMSTKETGIGLGLAVSHRIAERHGGSLSAHNRPEGGACFELHLTAATPAVTAGTR
jgi:signal transduction histidine kinase